MLLAVTGGTAGVGPVLLATAPPAWAFQAEAQMIETDPKVYAFNPPVIEIYVGDRVRWRNDTPVKHTVTSDPGSPVAFDSDEVPPPPPDSSQQARNEYTKRFTEPGRYDYRCKIHSNMRGVVQVTDPRVTSTTATTAPPPTTTTAPPTTTTTAPATTTTAPTTTTTLRPPAGVEPPPVPATAAAPPPTRATSSTTTIPSSTTTTTAPPPPTTAPSAPPSTSPEVAVPVPPTSSPPPSAPPATDPPQTEDTGDEESTAAGPISGDDETDPATVALVAALVAVGLFGAWTLIRVRPGRV